MAGYFAAVVTTAVSLVLAGTALAAPANTGALPSIASGTAQIGQTLTADPGGWTTTDPGGVTGFSYSWTRGGVGVQTGPAATYVVTAADAGQAVAVTVSASDATGSTAASPVSAGVVPVPPPSPAPTIAGNVQEGQPLMVNPGGWSGAPVLPFHYAWTSDGNPVGTDSASYIPQPSDVGVGNTTIAVIVSATYSSGLTASAASTSVGPVLPQTPQNATPPTITGTAQQGQVLTITPGTWTPVQSLITEQWEQCTALACTPAPGQIGTSYTVGAGDVGHTIRVLETDSNAASLGVVKASAQTATASATSATSVVAFSQSTPSTNQTVTLVATVSSNSGNGNPHGSLSFFNGSNAVPGCANKGVNGGLATTIVCQTSFGAGQAQISAAYVPDPASLVAGSTSDTTSVDVGKGPTSILLAVTPRVAPSGRATYVATLGVPLANAGSVLPSGSIDFLDGGQPIAGCANQVLSSLTATCSVSYASAGEHTITARYDGDPNFTGSTSSASGVQIVTGAPRAPVVRGRLGSTLGWKLFYHPHYSEMSELEAFAIAKGTTILIQCTGKGCPFASRKIKRASGQFDLLRPFRHRHLQAGARITVRFTRKDWVGKYYSITIRPGRKPKIIETCLAPGGVKPGAGCRSK
jgi:hypothetical protein